MINNVINCYKSGMHENKRCETGGSKEICLLLLVSAALKLSCSSPMLFHNDKLMYVWLYYDGIN